MGDAFSVLEAEGAEHLDSNMWMPLFVTLVECDDLGQEEMGSQVTFIRVNMKPQLFLSYQGNFLQLKRDVASP